MGGELSCDGMCRDGAYKVIPHGTVTLERANGTSAVGVVDEPAEDVTIEYRGGQKTVIGDFGGGTDTDKNKEYEARMKFLDKVPLMKRLPRDLHPLVASACVQSIYKKGEVIIRQGDPGDAFFVLREGKASVRVEDNGGQRKLATLAAGDYFGENALLHDEPRSATIVATERVVCLQISRQQFQELGLVNMLRFANRRAVLGNANTASPCKSTQKSWKEHEFIQQALKKNPNLELMVQLDKDRLESLTNAAWREEVRSGQEVITEGDHNADFFYVVESGRFEIAVGTQSAEPKSVETILKNVESKVVNTVTAGGSFGELALLYLVPRAATVTSTEDSVVWVIDRASFKRILMQASSSKLEEYNRYLTDVAMLTSLLQEERMSIARALVEMEFAKEDIVLQQGDQGSTFYILVEGTVAILVDGQKVSELDADAKRGVAQYFGEGALLDNEVRKATVQVISDKARALVLDRQDFETLLGPLKDIIDKERHKGLRKAATRDLQDTLKGQANAAAKIMRSNAGTRSKILLKDLKKIGLLGCGGFGTVELYEQEKSKETFALKSLSKGFVVKAGMQASVMSEKNILLSTNSLFVVKLFETYNTPQSLHFLLEAALGGELYSIYNRKSLHGKEKHAKFYSAGVICAFDHLHERRIIYRDLKPENLLLTAEGFIKLTDMGLAKFVVGKTYTTCGTPDYFAPELISSSGHTIALDWWTLGILVFELMVGHPPFEAPQPMQIYQKVSKGIKAVAFPQACRGEAEKLIRALLVKKPSERLPMRPSGSELLRQHGWYIGFNWEKFENCTMDPPFKPVVKSPKDLSNFSARKEDCPKPVAYKDPGDGWDVEFATVQ